MKVAFYIFLALSLAVIGALLFLAFDMIGELPTQEIRTSTDMLWTMVLVLGLWLLGLLTGIASRE